MTISEIVECSVCHSKYNFKILCDHVMNHRDMPIRIGCHNCGNLMSGSISKIGITMTNALVTHEESSLLQPYPCVGISLELPIVKECYFKTGSIVNNVLLVPVYVGPKAIDKHGLKMKNLEGSFYSKFNNLEILHNIKVGGNMAVFDQFAKEHFDKDDNDITDTPNKMRLGFVNLYEQLFRHIRSHSYTMQFCHTYLDPLFEEVRKLTPKERNDINTTISAYMDLQRDYDEAIKLLLDFWKKRAHFYPVMLLLETGEFNKDYAGELYLSTVDYEEIKELYANLFELLSRFSMYMVALENKQVRGDFDLLSDGKPLSTFCSKTNGNKSEFINSSCTLNGYYLRTLDNKIRNGIDHAKTTCDGRTQIISYFPNIKNPNDKKEIALIDFTYIILQQAMKLSESMLVVSSFLV